MCFFQFFKPKGSMVFEQVDMAIFRLKRGNETLEEFSKLEIANKTLRGSWWWGWLSCDVQGWPRTPVQHQDRGYPRALGLN